MVRTTFIFPDDEYAEYLVRKISENKKISKKTEKKLNKMSFSDKEVDVLKSLSQKMSKMVTKLSLIHISEPTRPY